MAPGSEGASNGRRDWTFWLALAGRGWGKTRVGSEWVIEKARENPGCHIALVGATADDTKKTMLSSGLESVEGAAGILAVAPPDFYPAYLSSTRTLSFPNGTRCTLYSAEEPNRLRGPQHHFAWVDELAAWDRDQAAFDQLMFGLRLGGRPQACITTTPLPIDILRGLLKNKETVVTRGTTYENRSNLSELYFRSIITKYEGTRLGRQELEGVLLEDHPGALWTAAQIDLLRTKTAPREYKRIVVAIDPAASENIESAETGIVVAGIADCFCTGKIEEHGFVIADQTCKLSPDGWAKEAIAAYKEHKADRIIAETNQGGSMVEAVLRATDDRIPYRSVRAKEGKRVRAEPIAALYEQGKVHHIGLFEKLEDQLTSWDPLVSKRSPDRLDALVWAFTELMLGSHAPPLTQPEDLGQRRTAHASVSDDWDD